MSVVWEKHYSSHLAAEELGRELTPLLEGKGEVIYLCIGTDKNILDCMGPLVGSMLSSMSPGLKIYGTLDAPLHAQNLSSLIKEIRAKHPQAYEVAIDASVGRPDRVGYVRLRRGGIIPGKATSRWLPEVGDIAITGVVAPRREDYAAINLDQGSLTPAYHMARTIAGAIVRASNM